MKRFLTTLRTRNPLLYYFGWLNLLGALVCGIMIFVNDVQVLGINAWIKPMKFFVSIAIFSWTMGWYLAYLKRPVAANAYSIMVILVLTFEMAVIVWQAANGRLSHFNISTPLYSLLFQLMGIAITILGVWTAYICYLFFRLKAIDLSPAYLWGIRLGILFFVIFSFEGAIMAAQLRHTVGAPDGSPGLPVVNWSRQYGDLRIAHFVGMHALQVLPLAGYFIFRRLPGLILFSVLYFALALGMTIMALKGIPLIP
ncbi:MAG TPA: hypothetical protein VD993_03095 [Chitinophagaceae bacterium]|nr:hypothetical protein [Chitinophagaceae bacterium]